MGGDTPRTSAGTKGRMGAVAERQGVAREEPKEKEHGSRQVAGRERYAVEAKGFHFSWYAAKHGDIREAIDAAMDDEGRLDD